MQQLPKPQPKRVPLGEPIDWTDADLEQMTQVSQADIKHAYLFFADIHKLNIQPLTNP